MHTITRGGKTRHKAAFSMQPGPGDGGAVPSCQILIEPKNVRSDDSRHGVLYDVAGGHHAKDAAIDDTMISSTLSQSCLQQSSTSSDYALRKVENTKFTKDIRSVDPT